MLYLASHVEQLSYEPLGEPNPAVFNLGVAVLLVRMHTRHGLSCTSSSVTHSQLLVITVSATFYALVDWHASRIMNSIKTLIAEEAMVIRDGKQQNVQVTLGAQPAKK